MVYKYLHLYLMRDQCKLILGCNRFYLHYVVLPALHYLRLVINEVHWDDRLYHGNHTPHFPFLFTGCVDTFPMYVQQPINSELRKALYNPKYGGCVYKGQLGIDFLGMLMLKCFATLLLIIVIGRIVLAQVLTWD